MRWIYLSVFALLVSGCTTIQPQLTQVQTESGSSATFRYETYARTLETFVDGAGQVDYQKIKTNSTDLERFYQQIVRISPDSHPQLFPSENDKLAYWLNAYNASVIKAVLFHYPIDSVKSVRAPVLSWVTPSGSGFFLFQRITLGGVTTSLYFLENGVIRKRFDDPRIHFALNCASSSCPKLPTTPFLPTKLDQQLQNESQKFVSDRANVSVNHAQQTIHLNAIFKWYRSDFIGWLETNSPDRPATLPVYIAQFLAVDKANELRQAGESYAIQFNTYDWRLNDQQRFR